MAERTNRRSVPLRIDLSVWLAVGVVLIAIAIGRALGKHVLIWSRSSLFEMGVFSSGPEQVFFFCFKLRSILSSRAIGPLSSVPC